MFFVFFIQAAEYDAADLFHPARLWMLTKDGRLWTIERILALLSGEMRAIILKHGLLRIISDCLVDSVSAIVAFARADKTHWTAPDCLNWFLYDFTVTIIISEPK